MDWTIYVNIIYARDILQRVKSANQPQFTVPYNTCPPMCQPAPKSVCQPALHLNQHYDKITKIGSNYFT